VNIDGVNTLFDRIAHAVLPWQRFFNRLGQLVFVHPEKDVTLVGPSNLNGLLSSRVEIRCFAKQNGKVQPKGHRLLRQDYVGAFVQSPRVLSRFPRLAHYSHSPLFDCNWKLIARPGYHTASGIYYAGPHIQCTRGTRLLDRLLSEFCWKSPIDRVNYIGMLVTGVTILHWLGKHPIAIFNANQPRLGKTLLARILGFILHGACVTVSYNANDEEFEKHLATRVEGGDRVIVIDNAKRTARVPEINSPVLERSITDTVLNFRRLGSNTAIRRPNDVIFCLTMNDAKLSADLRQRSVPINLEFIGNVRKREFSIPDMEAWVMPNRLELLGEVVGMVDRWVRAGYPMPSSPARHSVSLAWAASTDAILELAGLSGFMQNLESAEQAFDSNYEAMLDVCEAFHSAARTTASEWADRLNEANILTDLLLDTVGFAKAAHAQATIVGSMFSKFVGTTFEVEAGGYRLAATSKGKSHLSTEYWFERVDERRTASEPCQQLTRRLGTPGPQEPVS